MAFLSCLLSAVLLTLSFPQIQWAFLAWVALVPLLLVMDGQKPWTAFRRAYLCGFLFFAGTLGWIVYVTWPGTILLVAFLSLYFAIFGAMFIRFQRLPVLARIFVMPAAWVALEFVRGHLFSGFGWDMLGHTQYKNIWLIQVADITGAYGISYLVMMVNLLVFETIKARAFLPKPTASVVLVLASVLGYGGYTLSHIPDYPTVNVGVVQPNIPLVVAWDDRLKPSIVDTTIRLTDQLKDKNLDLIVWPETSLPGEIVDSPLLVYEIRQTAIKLHTPILIGSIGQEGEHYYNSAFLIGADGQMHGRYDKIHLVPFGEYLPLRPILGWINRFVELDDFTPGRNYKIFTLNPKQQFGTLICFEDTLSDLSRHFAQAGARFFINMSNDAWFRATKEPFMHLQVATFGCVENHRSLAHAGNTGASALIDPWGRTITMVTDASGKKIFTRGVAFGRLPVNGKETFYTKYGDVFTKLCFLCILVAAILLK